MVLTQPIVVVSLNVVVRYLKEMASFQYLIGLYFQESNQSDICMR